MQRIRTSSARMRLMAVLATTACLVIVTTACRGGTGPTPAASKPSAPTATATSASAAPGATPRTISLPYTPAIDPANFSKRIDNPFFPLVPGTRFIYEGDGVDGHQRNVTEVTRETKKVLGVEVVVVHDTVSLNGAAEEETFDWYAQDKDGNVWYFGEDTTKFTGPKAGTTGSFSAGVDGALPGIIMLGTPRVGDQYRQEYYKGHAEDIAEVLTLTGTETVPHGGAYKDLLVTKDVNPLDSAAAIENKYFAKGIGFIAVKHVTGPAERLELVKIEKF